MVRTSITPLQIVMALLFFPAPSPPAQTTPPITLIVRPADGQSRFRPGEIIPIELAFTSAVPHRFHVDGATYDRSGRLTSDQFQIEPEHAVMDPMLDHFASSAAPFRGGIRTISALSGEPVTVRLELNDWFRFDTAGMYRLSVWSWRVYEIRETDSMRSWVPVESQMMSFEILPRDPEWEASAVDAALRVLESPSYVERWKGCRILRFLGTDAAVDEMIKRYNGEGECAFEYVAGLFGAQNRARVVRQLEAGLQTKGKRITERYLRTLAILSVYAEHPEFRVEQTRRNKGKLEVYGEISRHRDLIEAAQAKYRRMLVAQEH